VLKTVQTELNWPSEASLFDPKGSGVSIIATLARNKIQQRINKLKGGENARVGILTPDPNSRTTQSPLALVCEFHKTIPIETLQELHTLAWNFSRTPLLITIEPHRLRAFTCCELPERDLSNDMKLKAEISEVEYTFEQPKSLSDKAAAALHWLNIANGVIQRRYPQRFDRSQTADNTLLDNLKVVRYKLHEDGLDFDLIHDLLARLIFIQFLFQRCDSKGVSALNETYLKRLYQENILSSECKNLGDILNNYDDTYALFKYLNQHFNGDLFTGKSDSKEEREREWRKETRQVRKKHISLLRDFVLGEMEIRTGQRALWPFYSFDTIPLEFISNIYESFVTKRKGTVYTPVHLVDFVLDGVLPWDGDEWDLKILDPACGSGIFLVRAYQRLVHRWKNANPDTPVRTDVLKRLLTHNLTGVDIDQHAVRVASFSLYLAMCDELNPRHYWKQIRFPKLRGVKLITSDFFSEEISGFNTETDSDTYDLVIGNPPWGKNQVKETCKEFDSDAASSWSKKYQWPISYGDPGTLFIAKAAKLTKKHGQISVLQPSGTLLYNQSGPAIRQRKQLFSQHQVEEIVNLSSLRFGLFNTAVGPSSIITLRPCEKDHDYTFTYIIVKPGVAGENDYRLVIDPYDVHEVHSQEAVNDPLVLTALTWGGPRDLAFLRQLARFPTIKSYVEDGKLKTRMGVVRGNRKKNELAIKNQKFFTERDFPQSSLLHLKASDITVNEDSYIHDRDSTDFSAFESPQLLIKRSWRRVTGRFRAVRILPEKKEKVLCSDSYISVNSVSGDTLALDAACLALNSQLATYYLLLTSSQFSNYRDTTTVKEILSVPCPPVENVSLETIRSFTELDLNVNEAFNFKESEHVLIKDLIETTLPYFKEGETSVACKATHRNENKQSQELTAYCDWFLRVLTAMFGADKSISATIFEESDDFHLPVRLIAIHLDWPKQTPVSIESFNEGELSNKLTELYSNLSGEIENSLIYFKKIARVFSTIEHDGKMVPTIFIAKPDERRYWTRSIAMRDADEVASEILNWHETKDREMNAG